LGEPMGLNRQHNPSDNGSRGVINDDRAAVR
jgi:hypothetical protein